MLGPRNDQRYEGRTEIGGKENIPLESEGLDALSLEVAGRSVQSSNLERRRLTNARSPTVGQVLMEDTKSPEERTTPWSYEPTHAPARIPGIRVPCLSTGASVSGVNGARKRDSTYGLTKIGRGAASRRTR